jgi:hypothetical protein
MCFSFVDLVLAGGQPALQQTVALSTTKVEFMSLTEAMKEAIWLHGFLGDLGIEQVDRVVFCDNQIAIYFAKHKKFHERTKHIDLCNFFILFHVKKEDLYVEKIGIENNPTDMLTKMVPKAKFEHCLNLVGIHSDPS